MFGYGRGWNCWHHWGPGYGYWAGGRGIGPYWWRYYGRFFKPWWLYRYEVTPGSKGYLRAELELLKEEKEDLEREIAELEKRLSGSV